ncbi:N-acetylmuramoyl-L-alanine amidase family protein [Tissierella sp. MSJ-40]|uniref:N-acetylmuramoyl-L-alanine amidase family protein n=1 Tax=Tissierella simiarum TaxID=2841534 RepID=A0ABS6E1W1_9FIRM|nr:N-acetylmuramoyl-L-alanine amidase family protein [Tissierella simiarum]MBU5436420.1 N-acetylmuramoyl-L-alanine amidase family protein [Tissierella simiarum]
MKKWKVVLSFLVFFLLINSTGFAASKNGNINVNINGQNLSVKEVPIIMNGQTVTYNTPSFIYIDRTLVPLTFITEKYGAKVDWNQKTKTATVNYKDKEIKLSIDSPMVYVNGKTMILDKNSIPKLVTFSNKDSKTMVPLAFISEVFGYEVGWDDINKVPYINSNSQDKPEENKGIGDITNISIDKGSTKNNKVIINGNKSLNFETSFLQDPYKLVIDIKDAKLNLKNTGNGQGSITVNDGTINTIEYLQLSNDPNVTRVTINVNKKIEFDAVPSSDGKAIEVSFVNKVKSVDKELIDGKEAIVVRGTKTPEINVVKLKNPERLVIDLMDSSLEGGTFFNYDYNLGFVKGVRVSQFTPDNLYNAKDRIVRIVLDAKDGMTDPNVKIDTYEDKIVIYPEKNFWESIDYTADGKNRIVTINNLNETSYSVDFDSGKKKMEVTIPSSSVDLKEGVVVIKDGLVDEMEVVKVGTDTKVRIKFRRSIDYSVLSKPVDNKVTISLKKDDNVTSSDRLIVIDAGHGGKDPGAVSPNKNKEKDINLNVSLKLNEKLTSLGYNTLMIRDTDDFVDLYERARIANDNYADVFISIHSNSNDNKSIDGIQVLYCPAAKSEKKEEDDHPLAKIMMEEMTKGTGAKNRGIVQRPGLVVLRETKMPAVLLEIGFLTNPDEEKLITNSDYQNKLVDSIIKGVERYFETY